MLCLLYRQLRDGQRAVAAARRAVEATNGLPPRFLAMSYVELASAEQISGDSVAALATITKALDIERQLTGADLPERHKLGSHYVTAARVAQSAVRFDAALVFAQSGIEILGKRLLDQPNDAVSARDVMLLYLTAADCIGSRDRPERFWPTPPVRCPTTVKDWSWQKESPRRTPTMPPHNSIWPSRPERLPDRLMTPIPQRGNPAL